MPKPKKRPLTAAEKTFKRKVDRHKTLIERLSKQWSALEPLIEAAGGTLDGYAILMVPSAKVARATVSDDSGVPGSPAKPVPFMSGCLAPYKMGE